MDGGFAGAQSPPFSCNAQYVPICEQIENAGGEKAASCPILRDSLDEQEIK